MHECLERVPDNIDAMKELLLYGLKGTDLEALVAIGKGEDKGRSARRGRRSFGSVDCLIPHR